MMQAETVATMRLQDRLFIALTVLAMLGTVTLIAAVVLSR
jgi:hypothetical protein